ncbi:MAG TPA: cupin domain-containing protein [Verrucomicrobiales bacterium]|nr:cupin domain-containing protein [Verrucomicrobiales bacterium]
MKRFELARFDELEPVRCPCGEARRAFAGIPGAVASMHVVEIWEDSRTHYHKKTTELYYVLEGEGKLEADGEEILLRPGTAVLIKPGCRHRAVGRLCILNVPVPAFDPADEWLDDES